MKTAITLLSLAGAWMVSPLSAQELRILSLDANSVLTWTNQSLCVTCRVEWAASVDGPWHGDWDSLKEMVVTSNVMARPVPRFFRLACTPARTQLIASISGTATLMMLTNRFDDPNFVILDVRTPGEYATRHIKGAVNLDYYSPTFSSDLALLDRCATYIVHCASGSRSQPTVQQMSALGFMEVYDLGALNNFVIVSGSDAWLEP